MKKKIFETKSQQTKNWKKQNLNHKKAKKGYYNKNRVLCKRKKRKKIIIKRREKKWNKSKSETTIFVAVYEQ